MSITDKTIPPIHLAFRALAKLTHTSEELFFLTEEINLYLKVLSARGSRSQLSTHDLKILFARMCDLVHILPNHSEPASALPPSEEIKINCGRLEDITNRISKKPGKIET